MDPVIFVAVSGPNSTRVSAVTSSDSGGPVVVKGKSLPAIPAPMSPALPANTKSAGASTQNTAIVPDSPRVQVDGSFDSDHGSMTVQIPVGPMTREVGLSLRSGFGSDSSGSPMLDQMELVDQQGDTLAHLGPLWNPQSNGPTDAVTVSLDDAPVGGSLLVQISAPPGVNGVSPSLTGSQSGPAWTLPFVMDVQKSQGLASGGAGTLGSFVGSLAVSGPSSLGTLTWSTDRRDEASGASVTAATDAGDDGSGLAVVAEASQIPPGDESADADSESPADFSGRLATGPLASRSAAPLGPNLATVLIDPAPTVDRHERALLQALDSRDAETDETRYVTSRRTGRSDRADEGGERRDTIPRGMAVRSRSPASARCR